MRVLSHALFFFFNDTATTEIYTLSLHDALPIFPDFSRTALPPRDSVRKSGTDPRTDRKSTRLNSSHSQISYAVFCLKKKKRKAQTATTSAPLQKTSRASKHGHLRAPELSTPEHV